MDAEPPFPFPGRADPVAAGRRSVATERAGLVALEASLAPGTALAAGFAQAVAVLHDITGRVIVTGMGKSGHIGRKLAATLASTGTAASFVHAAEASHGDLGMIRQGDAVLALSWSGETAELADIITYAKRFRIPLLALTANRESALGREADICLALPVAEEACPNGLAPTTSTTMQLVLGDALAVALLEARGFSAVDFKVFHPGGKLGARLTFVRDVMHRGAEIPLVPLRAGMAETVMEMTGKRFGCVGVVDAAGLLVGIITDGDLRRHMGPALMSLSAEAVMTRGPTVIEPDALAVEALALLNEKRRSVLLVVEEGMRPAGILHLHDLYGIGVG